MLMWCVRALKCKQVAQHEQNGNWHKYLNFPDKELCVFFKSLQFWLNEIAINVNASFYMLWISALIRIENLLCHVNLIGWNHILWIKNQMYCHFMQLVQWCVKCVQCICHTFSIFYLRIINNFLTFINLIHI